jgi:hypothetical protein
MNKNLRCMNKNLKPQTPHPRERGKASNGTILVDAAKTAAWETRWNRDFAPLWEERGGKLYPRESEPKK